MQPQKRKCRDASSAIYPGGPQTSPVPTEAPTGPGDVTYSLPGALVVDSHLRGCILHERWEMPYSTSGVPVPGVDLGHGEGKRNWQEGGHLSSSIKNVYCVQLVIQTALPQAHFTEEETEA